MPCVWVCQHAHTHTHTNAHKHTLLERCLHRERERGRLYSTNSGRCQSRAGASSRHSPLCVAPVGPEIRPRAHGPARGCQGGGQDGTLWHGVTLLPSLRLGSTRGGERRASCFVCRCVYLVSGREPAQWEGSGGLTPHSPSAAGREAGGGHELQHGRTDTYARRESLSGSVLFCSVSCHVLICVFESTGLFKVELLDR